MKKIKIEKGVPLPKQQRMRTNAYPFEEMQPGDSFFVSVKDAKEKARVLNRVAVYRRTTGAKMTTRTVTGGLRIWLLTRETKEQSPVVRAA